MRRQGRAWDVPARAEVCSATDAFLLADQCALLAAGGSRQVQLTFPSDGDHPLLRGRVYALYMAAVDEDHLVCQFRDVTEQRHLQQQLEHHAGHDELTELPNRRLLWEHLDLALARLARGGHSLVLLLCDLDRFKVVNDTHGHDAGDDLLRQTGRRLQAVLRPQDVLARYGGDEFVVLCQDLSEADAMGLVERLRTAVAEAFVLRGGGQAHIGISIGLTMAHQRVAPDELVRQADESLYVDERERPTAS